MLKTLWTVFSILLLLHVVALIGFVLWLRSNDRLDDERVQRVREMLSMTVEQEKQQEEQAKLLAEEAEKTALDLARLESVSDGPTTLADRLNAQQERDEVALIRLDRLQKDIQNLQNQLELAKRQLNKEREDQEAKQEAFEEAAKAQSELENDENFRQAVGMYEQLKPKQTKQMFQDLLNQGKADQVVDYLASMQQRKAAGVLKQFKTPAEIGQATDLLQRLRERGIDPEDMGM